MMSVPPPGGKPTTIRTGLTGKFGPPAWGQQSAVQIASVAPTSKVTRFRMGDSLSRGRKICGVISALIHARAAFLHDPCPARDVGLDELAEVRRRVSHGLEAEGGDTLAHFRVL